MKPTLLVLAAGMGSRYGGLKQMDGLGPHGEPVQFDFVTQEVDKIPAGFPQALPQGSLGEYDRTVLPSQRDSKTA